ncbi:MAG: hypothetical protein IPJ84_06540 [Bdellovibrionales bacterium]|nr:hypothetical protein [Bdellovibrionales bacterium]
MKILVLATVAAMVVAGCASTGGQSAEHGATARNPSAIPADSCYSDPAASAIPMDLSVFSYNLNPGDGHDQPEVGFYNQMMNFESIDADICKLGKMVAARRKPKGWSVECGDDFSDPRCALKGVYHLPCRKNGDRSALRFQPNWKF